MHEACWDSKLAASAALGKMRAVVLFGCLNCLLHGASPGDLLVCRSPERVASHVGLLHELV